MAICFKLGTSSFFFLQAGDHIEISAQNPKWVGLMKVHFLNGVKEIDFLSYWLVEIYISEMAMYVGA